MPSDRHTSATVRPCLREQQFSLPESVDYLFDGVFLPCHPDHLVKDPISRSGARLASMGCLRGPGETIEVKRGWRKARFQVVWVAGDGAHILGSSSAVINLQSFGSLWRRPRLKGERA